MVMNQDFTHAFEIITCGSILLALVDKSLWNFPSVKGRPSACLMDDPYALGRPFC